MRRALLLAAFNMACRHPVGTHDTRSLHYVGGELVTSQPVAAGAYEAYLKARLALQAEPPDLAGAREYLRQALRYTPDDPHLWVTLAEVELRAGDGPSANVALNKALALSPDYPPAQALSAQLRDGTLAHQGPSSDH